METRKPPSAYSEKNTARDFGVQITTLRFYQTLAIVRPIFLDGTLYYSERDRVRIQVTQKALRLGFSLDDVQKLLEVPREQQSKRLNDVAIGGQYLMSLVQRASVAVRTSRQIIDKRPTETAKTLDNIARIRAALCAQRELLSHGTTERIGP